MFVDEVTITVASGRGGNGAATFRREKYVPKGGPDGGNGGKGGDVVFVANVQLHTLRDQRYSRHYNAEKGRPGAAGLKDGKYGEDVLVQVPCGTILRDAETDEILADLTEDGQRFIAAKGGIGGRGNSNFATPTNQAPRYAEEGKPGEEKTINMELKLIADAGLVGLPNAGKSTLISVISAAKPKIADYPFTTLEPNLGIVRYKDFKSFTVADIPGLIEGAHEGKGLGIQFLKHVERTRTLVILIDCLSPDYEEEYKVLRNELESYSVELGRKPFIVALSKADTADEEVQKRRDEFAQAIDKPVHMFSAVSSAGVQELLELIWDTISSELS